MMLEILILICVVHLPRYNAITIRILRFLGINYHNILRRLANGQWLTRANHHMDFHKLMMLSHRLDFDWQRRRWTLFSYVVLRFLYMYDLLDMASHGNLKLFE
jgi:hypothetical protein